MDRIKYKSVISRSRRKNFDSLKSQVAGGASLHMEVSIRGLMLLLPMVIVILYPPDLLCSTCLLAVIDTGQLLLRMASAN